MRVLDLFCGAGGAAMGYYRAFGPDCQIVGIDIKPQPRYPFEFVQGDALKYCAEHGAEFDFIHASPPCQRFSEATPVDYREKYPNLIGPIRILMQATGKPFIIENVELARSKLHNPIMLCGTMFELGVWRHRYFETYPIITTLLPPCAHVGNPVIVSGRSNRKLPNGKRIGRYPPDVKGYAMGIDWMTSAEMADAIPPAYTEWIGRQLLPVLRG